MQIKRYDSLGAEELRTFLARPSSAASADVRAIVKGIFDTIKTGGDDAILAYTAEFDGVELRNIHYTVSDRDFLSLPDGAKAAIDTAIATITAMHEAVKPTHTKIETMPGVMCEQIWRGLETVGLYIPGGSAPLVSTLMMLAVPARIAGVENIVVATPPQSYEQPLEPAIAYALTKLGIAEIILAGGAQAIAAMTYGTSSTPKVDKVFGPGNIFVDVAKQYAANLNGGPLIDMPAGPSEVLVIADENADPDFVAADLLAQAEHDPLAQVVLVCFSEDFAERVNNAARAQTERLSRADIIEQSLSSACAVVVNTRSNAIDVSNSYAPEHLILQVQDASSWVDDVKHAGSIFVGAFTPESAGDYASGTNHVLPTSGAARRYSGLSTQSFMKSMTVQSISEDGLAALGPTITTLADLEGLDAHAAAVTIRLNQKREPK